MHIAHNRLLLPDLRGFGQAKRQKTGSYGRSAAFCVCVGRDLGGLRKYGQSAERAASLPLYWKEPLPTASDRLPDCLQSASARSVFPFHWN